MPDDALIASAGVESSLTPKMGRNDPEINKTWRPIGELAHVLEQRASERRIAVQRAMVGALRARVERALFERNDPAAEDAHAELIRAEFRLMRMEGAE